MNQGIRMFPKRVTNLASSSSVSAGFSAWSWRVSAQYGFGNMSLRSFLALHHANCALVVGYQALEDAVECL